MIGILLLAASCGGGGDGGKDAGFDAWWLDAGSDLHVIDPGEPGDDGRADAAMPSDAVGDVPRPDDVPTPSDATDVYPEDTGLDTGLDVWVHPCPRVPGPDDFVRKVVVSLPYDDDGKSNRFAVLDLATDGTLTPTGATFDLGRRFMGTISFTMDGRVGLVATEEGHLGVFRFEDDGSVTVVDPGFDGSFYASDVVMDPFVGDHVWVLNTQWRENGGGLYAVHLGCDATPTDLGLIAAGKLVSGLSFAQKDPGFALVSAVDILDSEAGHTAHRLSLSGDPLYLGGADAFGDAFANISAIKATHGGRHVLLGDNQEFSNPDLPNRVAVVQITEDTLVPKQILTPIQDPTAILDSPWGNAMLVVSGYGNNAFVLAYDMNGDPPFVDNGAVPWGEAGKPQLPGGAVMIERGSLMGLVLMTEVRGIRTLRFEEDGTVTDLGLTELGDGVGDMPGAIGVQP